jgi:hypothetical protein
MTQRGVAATKENCPPMTQTAQMKRRNECKEGDGEMKMGMAGMIFPVRY